MSFGIDFITGLCLGIEHVEAFPEEGIGSCIVLDLLFIRFVLEFDLPE